MSENSTTPLTGVHQGPEDILLCPATIADKDRATLKAVLGKMEVTRLTVERGNSTQTLRRYQEGWFLTCRNARY